eukprot:TRINITY_DN38044_c0_g1_i1.p1 TRINITY_DN38044_c0_g1~~TRINITY_DN38044_c0_g1_i1.p1  ORF type:complete len:260 (-),score=67.53 TRINITY_DN38044_c0_g1_i1:81-860(-)
MIYSSCFVCSYIYQVSSFPNFFFFFNDTATTEIYTLHIVGSVRCVQETESLKNLLEIMLRQLENYIQTKEDLTEIEKQLSDYDNLEQLIDIIKNIFSHFVNKMEVKLKTPQQNNSQDNSQNQSEEYFQLEKIVQKHESEIRTHIRLEQQLKLYAETLQQKIDDSDKSTNKLVSTLKKENQTQSETIQKLKEEMSKYKTQVVELTNKVKSQEEIHQNNIQLREQVTNLEKNLQDTKQALSIQSLQQENQSQKKNQFQYQH